jgi:hypothetical protein
MSDVIESWQIEYFILQQQQTFKCLIPGCQVDFTTTRKNNFKQHYEKFHQKMYRTVTGEARTELFKALQKCVISDNVVNVIEEPKEPVDKLGSYLMAHEILKSKRPFTDGDYIKNCAVKLAESVGENKAAKKLQRIPSSRRTICRRSEEIGAYYEITLKDLCREAIFTSLQLDESTDVSGIAEVLIFARLAFDDFEVQEELLDIVALTGHTRGIDMFNALDGVVKSFDIKQKLSLICTDGCPSMIGEKDGLAGLLKQHGYECQCLHCIVHRFTLASKIINHDIVMSIAIKCTNKLRGGNNSLRRRKFRKFLESKNAPFRELLFGNRSKMAQQRQIFSSFFRSIVIHQRVFNGND